MLTFFLSELEKQTEKIANLTRDISEMSNKLVNIDVSTVGVIVH